MNDYAVGHCYLGFLLQAAKQKFLDIHFKWEVALPPQFFWRICHDFRHKLVYVTEHSFIR